jgi:hypothetical protein
MAFRVIVRDGMGDVLHQHGLAGTRRRDDQGPLADAVGFALTMSQSHMISLTLLVRALRRIMHE